MFYLRDFRKAGLVTLDLLVKSFEGEFVCVFGWDGGVEKDSVKICDF